MKEKGQAWDIIGSYRVDVKDIMKLPEFASRFYTPKPGDTLYFDKGCTIPRIKCEGTWKRTVKIHNADVVVIPYPERIEKDEYAVFVNPVQQKVFMMRLWSDRPSGLMVGATIGHLVNEARRLGKLSKKYTNSSAYRATVDAVSDASCVFIGEVFTYIEREQFIFNVLDGLYPRIVFEADLMKLLGSEEEKFDSEFLTNMLELLSSKDRDTVHHGMRILASMDYTHYPSVTKYILNETRSNWESHKPFNSSVKFMLDRVEGIGSPFDKVTAEEFTLAKPIFEDIVRIRIEQSMRALQQQTNMKIEHTFDVSITLPEPAAVSEEPEKPEEDECPDCPKVEEVDFNFINK